MNSRTLGSLSLCLVLLAPALPAQSQDPAVLLERARHEAYVRGNLEIAINSLQTLVEKYRDNRSIAAGALVELGQLYESLGRAEARKAYQRVLSDYSEQREAGDLARARLAALEKVAAATPVEPSGLRLRKVWASQEGSFSNVSPDGRFVAFQDWGHVRDSAVRGNADVAVFDTRDQKIRMVTRRPSLSLVDVYPTGPFIWSRDQQWMAYGLHAVGWTHRELHIIRPEGTGDRKVLDNRQVADIRAWGFSSDNRFIVASVKGWDNIWRIGIVSLRDSSVAFLKTLGAEPVSLSLSPDDRFIAYSYATTAGSPSQDVLVLAVDGSAEAQVAKHPANDVGPQWTPQGDRIVFTSDRSGQRALWAVRWQGGKGDLEEPELIYPHLGNLELYGVTRSGALYFSAQAGGSEVYRATLDLLRDSVPSQPSRIPVSNLLTNQRPKWSPSGDRIAWLSQRGLGTEPRHLVVKTIATGTERAYPLAFLPGDSRAASFEWSEDGRAIQVQGRDLEKRFRASYRVELASGEATREDFLRDFSGLNGGAVTEFDFVDDRQSRMLRSLGIRLVGQTDWHLLHSGDLPFRPGETAIIVRNGVHRIRSIASYTAATPNGEPNRASEAQLDHLVDWGATDHWSLSPDGTRLAIDVSSDSVMDPNVLYLVPLPGGPARELVRLPRRGPDHGVITAIRWTADGKSVIYAVRRERLKSGEASREAAESWIIDAEGGPPRRLRLAISPYLITNLDVHPDGKTIAYTMWRDPVAEVWIAEGLPWQQRP
jgi:Tol biopolymer transport system component